MGYFSQQIVNGIHLGALYALLAFGYAISHGVLKRASFIHGALFAFAGQLTVLFTSFAWNVLWLVYPAALAAGLVAALVYAAGTARLTGVLVLAPLKDQAPNMTIGASLGVLIVLMEGVRLAAGSHSPWLSPFLNSVVELGSAGGFGVTTTPIKVAETATAVAIILAGGWYLAVSRAGRIWRAVTEDPIAAELMGVDSRAVFLAALTAAGLIAGIAGALAAFHYGNIDFGTGLTFAVKVLFLTSLGGLSHPAPAALGGLAIGMFEALWDGYFPNAWRDAATYLALCALLIATRRLGGTER